MGIVMQTQGIVMQKSHDEDSRKLNPDSCARSRLAKTAQVQKGIYANRTDIHEKQTLGLVRYSSGEREKKGNCEKTDKRQNTDIDSTDKQELFPTEDAGLFRGRLK